MFTTGTQILWGRFTKWVALSAEDFEGLTHFSKLCTDQPISSAMQTSRYLGVISTVFVSVMQCQATLSHIIGNEQNISFQA